MLNSIIVATRVWLWRLTHWQQWQAARETHRDLSNAMDWSRWKR